MNLILILLKRFQMYELNYHKPYGYIILQKKILIKYWNWAVPNLNVLANSLAIPVLTASM